MPAYNFKDQFADKVLNGSKPFTIRKKRKRPTVKGDKLFLYVGMRTRNCCQLMETTAKEVIPIKITRDDIYLDGQVLFESMKEGFARLDGFRNYTEFLNFHKPNFNSEELEMIIWDIDHATGVFEYITRRKNEVK